MLSRKPHMCKRCRGAFNPEKIPVGQMPKNSAAPETLQKVKQPAHQTAYENLRDKILFGTFAPGQAITIQGLADTLGTGMTPVREAIRRLIAAGALNMMDNRRVIVPELSDSGIEELDFMRKSIEPELARRAATRITAKQIAVLKQKDDALNTAISLGDIHAYLRQNYDFHAFIYGLADAPIIAATVERLWLRFGPSLRVVCGRYGTLNLPDKHAELLAAFLRRDPDAAATAMAEDVHQGMVQIHASLDATTPPGRFD